jgi:predicted nucleotidyltransferase
MVNQKFPLTPEEVQAVAQRYGEVLRDVFAAVEIRLFGSYLKNCAHEYSDIDFAIISRDFAGIEPYVAMKILQRLKIKVNSAIEPIPMTPKELANPELGTLAYDVAQNNLVLYKAIS